MTRSRTLANKSTIHRSLPCHGVSEISLYARGLFQYDRVQYLSRVEVEEHEHEKYSKSVDDVFISMLSVSMGHVFAELETEEKMTSMHFISASPYLIEHDVTASVGVDAVEFLSQETVIGRVLAD